MTAAVLAFASGALAVAGLAALAPRRRARAASGLPPPLLRLAVRAGRGGRAIRAPRDLAHRIEAAGAPGGLGERELMAAKLAAGATGALAGIGLAGLAPGRLGPLACAGAAVGGFLAPDLWLGAHARGRARRVRRELPAMLDLLRVSVEAGVSLPYALREVGRRTAGPLARAWVALARETELGVPFPAALGRMDRALPLPEVHRLTAAIDRASRHGAPLADALAAQAREARHALRRGVQEDAARAGPKIQLVVALLLVPSVLLLVAAALVAALLGGGAPGGL